MPVFKKPLTRRGFLSTLAAVPIGARLEFDPLAPTIFLPPRGGWPLSRPLLTRAAREHIVTVSDADIIWMPLYDYTLPRPRT